eukprot:scaffold6227_cov417-Prasinococcus_capsulatus_cf.AAC.3
MVGPRRPPDVARVAVLLHPRAVRHRPRPLSQIVLGNRQTAALTLMRGDPAHGAAQRAAYLLPARRTLGLVFQAQDEGVRRRLGSNDAGVSLVGQEERHQANASHHPHGYHEGSLSVLKDPQRDGVAQGDDDGDKHAES